MKKSSNKIELKHFKCFLFDSKSSVFCVNQTTRLMELSSLWDSTKVAGLRLLPSTPADVAVLFQICFALHEGNTSFGFDSITYEVYAVPQQEFHFYIKTKNLMRSTYDHFGVTTQYQVLVKADNNNAGNDISLAMIGRLIADFAAVPKIDRFAALMKDGNMSFGSAGSWGIGMALFMPLFASSYYRGEVNGPPPADAIIYERGHLPMWSKLTQADRDSQMLLLSKPATFVLNDFKSTIRSLITQYQKADTETDYDNFATVLNETYKLFHGLLGNNTKFDTIPNAAPFVVNSEFVDPANVSIVPYYTTYQGFDPRRGKRYIVLLLSVIASLSSDATNDMKLKDNASVAKDMARTRGLQTTIDPELDPIVKAFDSIINAEANLKQKKDAAILAYNSKRAAIKAATGNDSTTPTTAFDTLSSATTITDALIVDLTALVAGALQTELDAAVAANKATIAVIQLRFNAAKTTTDALVAEIIKLNSKIVATKPLVDAQTLINAVDAATLKTITDAEAAVAIVETTLISSLETERNNAQADWNAKNAAEAAKQKKAREAKLATCLADGQKHKDDALADKTIADASTDPKTIRTWSEQIKKHNVKVQECIKEAKNLKGQETDGIDAGIAALEAISTDILNWAAEVLKRGMTVDRDARLKKASDDYNAIGFEDEDIEEILAEIEVTEYDTDTELAEVFEDVNDRITTLSNTVVVTAQLKTLKGGQFIPDDAADYRAWQSFAKADTDALRGALNVVDDESDTVPKPTETFLKNVVGASDDLSRLRTQLAIYARLSSEMYEDPKRRKAYAFSQQIII